MTDQRTGVSYDTGKLGDTFGKKGLSEVFLTIEKGKQKKVKC